MGEVNPVFTLEEDESSSPSPWKSSKMEAESERPSHDLTYGIEDKPPWYLALLLGMQHYMMMVGGTMSIPVVLAPALCILPDDPAKAQLASTIIFVSGIITLLQATLGSRLPIVQGGTFALIVPTLAVLALEECPTEEELQGMNDDERKELWTTKMRQIQGGIICASLFEVVLGYFGLVGLVLRFFSPLVVTPVIALVGLALFEVAATHAATHWGIACMTIALIILFSQYMKKVSLPVPVYSKSKGFNFAWIAVFELFPVLLAMMVSWAVCGILTRLEVLDEKNGARTDLNLNILNKAPWFRVPYPGQWGMPTVSASAVFGMLAGILSSAVESIGDYYACARLAGAPTPPTHAINRGIGTEGLGSVLAGIIGSGNGTTSYSENIGAIGITKVGSRRVIQFGALLMIVFGVFGKFGALFVTIPEPVLGGMFCCLFAMISAVGISNLQFVDLNSTRNLFVLGFALFMGLAVPDWVKNHKSEISTGSDFWNQTIQVLLSTSMFVGGFIAFVLDNTIPGTAEERGLNKWHPQAKEGEDEDRKGLECYDFPFGMETWRRWKWTRYLPFSPTFKEWTFTCKSDSKA